MGELREMGELEDLDVSAELLVRITATRETLAPYNPVEPVVDLLLDLRTARGSHRIVEIVDEHLAAVSHRRLLAAGEILPMLAHLERHLHDRLPG
ncbi:hypothetical protein [Rhabdothermincola sediminis]|uniref:hypothetical protein n=1 Tax=Rhabdothermincola sediminis TaxID=2751370 RepID=UPI001AA096D5|nr:hypothetical protein [Rhabdothermincola sediminis]